MSSERRVSITKIEVQKKWFEHMPETVAENEEVTILCDMQIHRDSGSCHRTRLIQRLSLTRTSRY